MSNASSLALIDGGHQSMYWTGRCAEYLSGLDLFTPIAELAGDHQLIGAIESLVADEPAWQTKSFTSVFQFRLFRNLLYAIVRATKPGLVVETGVLHGLTSAFLLRACECNGRGRVVSVDLPSYAETGPANRDGYVATLPPGREPGWLVPVHLKDYWSLRLGASRSVLPSSAHEFQDLGLFIHDSDHTDEIMSFELEFAWERLLPDGILVCDNIDSCDAFDRFCRRVGRQPLRLPAPDLVMMSEVRFGLLRRTD